MATVAVVLIAPGLVRLALGVVEGEMLVIAKGLVVTLKETGTVALPTRPAASVTVTWKVSLAVWPRSSVALRVTLLLVPLAGLALTNAVELGDTRAQL